MIPGGAKAKPSQTINDLKCLTFLLHLTCIRMLTDFRELLDMQANVYFPGQNTIPKSKSRETASHTSLDYNSKTGKACDELMTCFH